MPAFEERRTGDLTPAEVSELRALLDRAFVGDADGRFTDDDWDHATGGCHVLARSGEALVGHASVVERVLRVDGQPIRAGYVEAVAVDPAWQGRGIGSGLMERLDRRIRSDFQLGALATGRHRFYERLGWRRWRGPTEVRAADGDRRTPEDDGAILVLETLATPWEQLPLDAPISCDWRAGDVW